ncbi:MAG: acetyl-CoA carboxylase biotin carboxyl carrier protein [Roseomonas sp.]|jgi:acetyl-CoA carboxylase biotin carboxyl carrier protein|nr:acetyl-CoA carboxylase biotin carboxyl carrier protein [Roseomonas sp.]MCA3431056.1 acetyl-CoA carboxylase biotin carboxyl carrier protein [Roseomonas sp.]MCA3434327.1 acetyl-CoA carboxylase biotin carboxyl carrier protein [Roseomonas sp.]MCE2919833.1 acetyl-CoA carboxylase biotin carboxyl carrier protein [Roseomonas sp.]MCZ8280479.1 acetyl-CoA carboxylase biotin carboxyl carrier protein [Acetobacteraceae bacterium]
MTKDLQFDPATIRELAQILRESDLTEIELVDNDMRVKLVRQVTVAPMAMPVAAAAHAAPSAAPAAAAAPAPAAPAAEVDADHPGAVNSPMVGVAYLSPEPTSAPFVTIGSKVTQGQTLMLIEAMKTYNQIKAPRAGTVTRILVESGTPVEFGEPLMIVE